MVFILKNSKSKLEECKSKTKLAGFAVLVDTHDSELIYNLKEAMKHYELKSSLSNRIFHKTPSYGDWVLFGAGKNYDYEILSTECEVLAKRNRKTTLSLDCDSKKVFSSLYSYYKKNRKPEKVSVVECECKVTRVPVRRVLSNVQPVRVHDNFVKVGYDIFPIKENFCTGKRSVKIDGKKFLVKKDHCGNQYLA